MSALRGLDALEDAITAVAAAPQTLVSDTWRCGTGMCIAGHLCERAGGQWISTPANDSFLAQHLVPLPGEAHVIVIGGGRTCVHAEYRAETILGFHRRLTDGRNLFSTRNTLADLQAALAGLRAAEAAGTLAGAVLELES